MDSTNATDRAGTCPGSSLPLSDNSLWARHLCPHPLVSSLDKEGLKTFQILRSNPLPFATQHYRLKLRKLLFFLKLSLLRKLFSFAILIPFCKSRSFRSLFILCSQSKREQSKQSKLISPLPHFLQDYLVSAAPTAAQLFTTTGGSSSAAFSTQQATNGPTYYLFCRKKY